MDFADLARLASGHVEARAVQVAVSLGIFDTLQEESLDAPTLASRVHADARATELLLNALTALGLLKKQSGRFSLAPASATYLVKDSPQYLGGMILFDASLWNAWGELEKAVRSGKPVRPPDMYQNKPKETERFILAMDSLVKARRDAEILMKVLDLSGVRELLDLGSGPGTYPIAFCRNHPQLRATIFDLPGTLKITARFVRDSRLKDRIRLVAGDYRIDPVPGRYQMIFLSNIIHAESSEENARLMAKLHSSLERGGRIVFKDHILEDGLTHPPVGAIFSLLMLLTTDRGRCYSFNEVREWLEKAGFAKVSQLRLPSPPFTSSLVLGEKG